MAAVEPMQKRARNLDACRHLLLRESQVQPLLLVFEDLHWIDNETQAFLDGMVDSLPAARVLLLVNYRPEYHNRWTPKPPTQIRVDPFGGGRRAGNARRAARTRYGGGRSGRC